MRLHVQKDSATQASVLGRCERCAFLKACGGRSAFEGMFNCFDDFPWKVGRDDVCPQNPAFADRLAEVHGLTFDELASLGQRSVQLPLYVPHLNHRYSRLLPLPWPIVAVTTYELFRRADGQEYRAVAKDERSLRSYFNLSPTTQVVLRGTEHDRPLERYWSHRRTSHAPEQLAALGVDLVIGPNYSQFIDVPRTDNLFNRKRQLLCLEEMAKAGLNVAPHLSAAVDADWNFWRRYLQVNPQITYVAKEFQTGNKPLAFGLESLRQLSSIQQHIGRPLHPILIGGSRLTEEAAVLFEQFTVLDSRPFMGAIKRKAFRAKGRKAIWYSDPTLPQFGIDELMRNNIDGYANWISIRAKSKAGLKHLKNRRAG